MSPKVQESKLRECGSDAVSQFADLRANASSARPDAAQAPQPSIFRRYYCEDQSFVDRYEKEPESAVDVIIPALHTNELWDKNLVSIFREIPVKRLLLGDGGCIDNTLNIARKFPRVTIHDHRNFTSLGYSLRKLIEEVETEWFVYLHSDVYLPEGWFDAMRNYQGVYDWYECPQHLTVLVDFPHSALNDPDWRAYSGSQMGRRAAFRDVLPAIDDDFLYRNEDIIYAKLIEKQGYRYGKVEDTFHYHQVMPKSSIWKREIRSLGVQVERSRPEEIREYTNQAKGIVKYLDPIPESIPVVLDCINRLVAMGETTWSEFEEWVEQTNPDWVPLLFRTSQRRRIKESAMAALYANYHLARSIAAVTVRGALRMIPLAKTSVHRG